jgi:tRNA G18 (ribose-2'-O)-methylase SpoU
MSAASGLVQLGDSDEVEPDDIASVPSLGVLVAEESAPLRRRSDGKPDSYMLIANVSKKNNIGNLMRSCVAFGVTEMIVVGVGRIQTFGAQGTERFMQVRQFAKTREAVNYLKGQGVSICGIEITPDASPVQTHPFAGPTAFLAGNEGDGLCDAHKAMCDHFVYIPQVGNGTASLNVTVATSIVLHHFCIWAGYDEIPRDGGRDKFALVAPVKKDADHLTSEDLAKREARAAAKSRPSNDVAPSDS